MREKTSKIGISSEHISINEEFCSRTHFVVLCIRDPERKVRTFIDLALACLKVSHKSYARGSLSQAYSVAPNIKDPATRASLLNRINQLMKKVKGK
ncbi:hypothetical protein ES703_35172 [subsurface metagenome]